MDPGAIAREAAAKTGLDLASLPGAMDMNADTITENVLTRNSNCSDPRMKFVFERLITHLHDFVREVSLTEEEWMAAIQFLTETGKMCTPVRQEFILLSDTLGVSTLVDSLNNAKPVGATENTVLGPFLTEDAQDVSHGGAIASEGKGNYMYVEGRVLSTKGEPIANAIIDTWETDGFGQYDIQYDDRQQPECRGRLRSREDGTYAFRAVVPVPYGIPDDGPVSGLVQKLGRHIIRPAHLHIKIQVPGYDTLTTALYFEGDPFVTSDVVFGVKSSLIVKADVVNDPELGKARGFPDPSKPHVYLKKDFVLPTTDEGKATRELLKVKATSLTVERTS